MIKFIDRRNKDYSRHNILKSILGSFKVNNDIFILLPFSKKKFLSLYLKKKIVINDFFISDFDTYVYDRQKGTKIKPSALHKLLLDLINFRCSSYLLSDTQSHFDYWETLFGRFKGKHLVFPVLADTNIYYPRDNSNQNNEPPHILFYGSFIPLHGIDIILNALKKCEENGIEFNAELVGEGQTLNEMLDLAATLGLKQVKFNQGMISEQVIAEKICNSDLILGIFGESIKAKSVIPNKVYQALACQSAVITQDSPAIREFFNDDHLCLVNRDPDELAKAIEQLIKNKEIRLSLAKKGHEAFQLLFDKSVRLLKEFVSQIDKTESKSTK